MWNINNDRYSNSESRTCQHFCRDLVNVNERKIMFDPSNIYIRFGTKLYGQIVGIPIGTNCDPLDTDLFLFCNERDFMKSLSGDNQSDIIEAFNSTSRYLDDL